MAKSSDDDQIRFPYSRDIREADIRWLNERDRRITEGNALRAEALRIEREGSEKALILAREIQDLHDEKANGLQRQMEEQRGNFPTKSEMASEIEKIETALAPVLTYIAAQQGGPRAITSTSMVTLLGAVALAAGIFFGFRSTSSTPAAPPTPVEVTVVIPTPTPAP